MGSSDSACCGSHDGPVKPDPFNDKSIPQRKMDTSGSGEQKKDENENEYEYGVDENDLYPKEKEVIKKAECITTGDINKCQSLQRCVEIIKKYDSWLESKDLSNKRKLRTMDGQTMDYDEYIEDIKQLISNDEYISYIRDSNHIKHYHHYDFKQIRQYIINKCTRNKNRECANDNCFSMKYFYLRNKEKYGAHSNNVLVRLTNLHVFLYHSMYISALNIKNVHPRNVYLVINYVQRKQRTLDIETYAETDMVNVVHLISFYYGAKFVEDEDALDTVSALGLARFIEQTMNKATLNQVWSKLDRDGSDTIDIDEVDDILLLTVILSIATAHKESGDSKAPQIDKTELKHLMQPIGDWMKRDKMIKQPVITKDEFRDTFSTWLKEYNRTNGGIIADEQMQKKMLIKYKINEDEKNGITDKFTSLFKDKKYKSDRLVVNCEYLTEHKPDHKINGKDDEYESLHGVETEEPSTN